MEERIQNRTRTQTRKSTENEQRCMRCGRIFADLNAPRCPYCRGRMVAVNEDNMNRKYLEG